MQLLICYSSTILNVGKPMTIPDKFLRYLMEFLEADCTNTAKLDSLELTQCKLRSIYKY